MQRHRGGMRLRTIAAAVLVSVGACGSGDEVAIQAAASPGSAVTPTEGLDVRLVEATVEGPAAASLRVEPQSAGLLLRDEPLLALVDVEASAPVSIGELVSFSGTAEAEDGPGVVGLAGLCGDGWGRDGRAWTSDPCSALEPITEVGAGPTALDLRLHARTEAGEALPGRYRVRLPLNDDSSLVVVYEAERHVPMTVEWVEPVAGLTVTLGELRDLGSGVPAALRIEDEFRREYETRMVDSASVVDFRLPAGVWRVVQLAPAGASTEPGSCGAQPVMLRPGAAEQVTLLSNLDAQGRCA